MERRGSSAFYLLRGSTVGIISRNYAYSCYGLGSGTELGDRCVFQKGLRDEKIELFVLAATGPDRYPRDDPDRDYGRITRSRHFAAHGASGQLTSGAAPPKGGALL